KLWNKLIYRNSLNKIIKKEHPDFIHCNDNTLFYVGKWIKKVKVVYDAHELLPQMAHGFRRKFTIFHERKYLKYVYKIILPQIDRLNYFYFEYKHIIQRPQLYLLENFPLKSNNIIPNYFLYKYDFVSDKKILSYVGTIVEERKILEVVRAVSKVEELIFFIIGNATPEYKSKIMKMIQNEKIEDRVFIKDPIPNEEVISVAESSNIGICFYSDLNLNSYFCASNKLYENLNAGMAVLANNIAGTARVIESGKNGYLIDEINVDEIYKGLKSIFSMKPPTPANYYWENQENILKEIYK